MKHSRGAALPARSSRRAPIKLHARQWLLALACLTNSTAICAADFQLGGRRDGNVAVTVSGQIDAADGASLRSLIAIAQSQALKISVLSLNSPGGSVVGGADLAITVRTAGINTAVDDAHMCASACFMVFAAGVGRHASSQARIGVHSATAADVGETRLAKSVTVDMARLLADFGVPAAVLGRLVTARPDAMAWLTADELRSMTQGSTPGSGQNSYAQRLAPDIASTAPFRTAVAPTEVQKARELVRKAQSMLRANLPNEALPLLKKAVDLNPVDADTVANYGEALFQVNQYAAAKDALALAIRLNPKRAAAHASLAQTLAALGDIDWAKDSLVSYYQLANHKDVIREQLLRWRSDTSSSPNLKRASDLAIRALDIG